MKDFDTEDVNICLQIRNMIKFLLLSIKSDKNITLTDIANFLERVDFLITKLCTKFEE